MSGRANSIRSFSCSRQQLLRHFLLKLVRPSYKREQSVDDVCFGGGKLNSESNPEHKEDLHHPG